MDVTEEIKARIDIVDFISRYVPLKRAGRSYKAPCPFHQEKTPSFVVFPETGTWRCFGACGVGGDVFTFLMKRENLDFREALHTLAEEAGVELVSQEDNSAEKERTRLYEANALAAQFFRNQLHRSPNAQPARSYLKQRGIDAQIAESFQLGYALDSWDTLLHHLGEQGYTPPELVRAGLVKHNEERNSYYDAFRDRVMIPIQDRQGRVIGFGGRVMGDSQPKYLNTAETPLFNKSNTLYGLDRAYRAIREQDGVVIVEGYMDVIAAHQFGHENVVACLGTALTEGQLKQLQRYTSNYTLALDSDSAGQQATIRGLNQARQALKRVRRPTLTPSGRVRMESRLAANLRIVALPEGKDPDDLIRKRPELWAGIVAKAEPLVDYFMRVITAQMDLGSAQGKAQAVGELAPLIAELDDDIERQHYVQQLSRLVQVDEQTIHHRIEAAARTLSLQPGQGERPKPSRSAGFRQGRPGPDQPPPPDGMEPPANFDPRSAYGSAPLGPLSPVRGADPRLEQFLLAQLLQEPNLLVWLSGSAHTLEIAPLRSDEFERGEYKEIFLALKRFMSSDELWDLETFQEQISIDLHGTLGNLFQQGATLPERSYQEMQEAVLKVLIRLRLDRLREDLNSMNFLLQDAQQNQDREAVLDYSAGINANRRERRHLDRVLQDINRIAYGTSPGHGGMRIA
jgi:DNA primase